MLGMKDESQQFGMVRVFGNAPNRFDGNLACAWHAVLRMEEVDYSGIIYYNILNF